MVNYNYLLRHIEHNNQQYLRDGTIAVSEGLESDGGRPKQGMTERWLRALVGGKVKVVE